MFSHIVLLASFVALGKAQDPANGWMAYAVGTIPDSADRITRLEMKWKVGATPRRSNAFFSPWFGMDGDDNLNLIQPVNPWLGSEWAMYTEYFQWRPVHNSNSPQKRVEAGQTLHGSLVYSDATDSYTLTQTVVETGATSSQVVKCQEGKKYRLPYVVYEKVARCNEYPPDGVVTFTDIVVECDGKDCADDVKWEAKVKDSNCDMTAHVTDSDISITWSTNMPSKYDNMTDAQIYNINYNGGHGWFAKAMDARGINATAVRIFGCNKDSSLNTCKACVEKEDIVLYPCYWCEIDSACHDVGSLESPCTPASADSKCVSLSTLSNCVGKSVDSCPSS